MALFDKIDTAESIDGLLMNVLRNHIPLQSIKTFVQSQLQNKSQESLRKIWYNERDLTKVIPTDICQHILVFAAMEPSIQSVCKSFKAMVERNRANWLRNRKTTASVQALPIAEQHHTHYVDPELKPLTQQQIDDGIEGPIQSMMEAMDLMKSGDKLILCAGYHRYDEEKVDLYSLYLRKDMRIEGIGECCIVFPSFCQVMIQCALSLKNMTVTAVPDITTGEETIFNLKGGYAIQMTDCHIIGCPWFIASGASLVCDRCSFKQSHISHEIEHGLNTSVTLIDCRFEADRPDLVKSAAGEETEELSIKLIGCTFGAKARSYLSIDWRKAMKRKTSCIMYNRLLPLNTDW